MVVRGGGYHTPPEKSRRRPQAAAAFRMIPDASVSILVRYGGNDELLRELRAAGPHRTLTRPWFRVLPDDDHEGVDLAELDLHDVVARRGVVGV